jgi:dipeptidyl aminopeptidase/acylaminoacyl peptidase
MLPHEAHGYMAKETIEHVVYETLAWLDRYVKGGDGETGSK